jgi:iron complex transport system ATP-binding protein
VKKETVISAVNLTIGYPKNRKQEKKIVHSTLSFALYSGELTCLLGSNGVGKSTLLRTLTGLQNALSGKVFLKEKEIHNYSEQELSILLGLVLTDKTSVGGLTVSELVALGRYPYTGFFGRLSQKDNEIIEKAMRDVGIIHKTQSYIAKLSDGERQKVMIAKALAQECPIIVLDEPTAFLDVVNRFEIMNLLHRLAVEQNKTILLSTHDIELALSLADRLWLLSKEKGLKTGITEDVVLSDAINQYISEDNIYFDKLNGRFLTQKKYSKEVFLQAEGELAYWTKNFLARNGFQISDNPNFHLKIKVNTSTDIIVQNKQETKSFASFEEFNSWILSDL